MNPASKILLVFTVVFSLAAGPTVLLALVYFFPESWRRTLHDYQTLAGSLVTLFAAGLALTGVWLTITSQTENVSKQLQVQRDQFDKERQERKRQTASAFIAEIKVIVASFATNDHEKYAQVMIDSIDEAQAKAHLGALPVVVARPGPDYAIFFRSNAHEVGQFPLPIPEDLLMFYGLYAQVQDNLMQISMASDQGFKHMGPPNVRAALIDQMRDLRGLRGLGTKLTSELQKIADEP